MSEQERLTPERLEELGQIAEVTTFLLRHGAVVDMSRYHEEFNPPTVLEMLYEIDRLRRERETLAAAVRRIDHLAKCLEGGHGKKHPARGVRADEFLAVTRSALALLDGEKGGDADE